MNYLESFLFLWELEIYNAFFIIIKKFKAFGISFASILLFK